MQPEKHPLEMLDIFTKIRHKNKKLLMVGRGLLENKLYDKVQKLGIGDQIVYEAVKYSVSMGMKPSR